MTVSNINFVHPHTLLISLFCTMEFILLSLYVVEQRPWSEWQRSDESCVQHTGLDVEQVQQLYDMCEQSLLDYCSHRNE
jgi:hypothetical protein